MKTCACCGTTAQDDAATCSACGEASWVEGAPDSGDGAKPKAPKPPKQHGDGAKPKAR